MSCGIGRVAAFIGVGVLGALIVAAVRANAPSLLLIVLLLAAAPLAGLLHWLESWLAHDMAYRLLAEMRIDLFRKLDALAPAYLLRRRSGDLVALATQDVETIEYFFAHTVAPAFVAVLMPGAVLVTLAVVAWPLALALLPFLVYAAASPVLGRQRIDRLGVDRARRAGRARRACDRDDPGPRRPGRVPGDRRGGATGSWRCARRYQAMRLALLHDLSRQTAGLEVATGLGGLAVAAVGAPLVLHGWIAPTLLPLLVLVSIAAFLPVSEIAQVGRQLADTIASTRRLHVVQAEPVPITDGPRVPAGAARRLDRALRACALHLSGPAACPRWRMSISTCRPARRWRWSGRRAPARRRSPTCCCASGIREPGAIRLDGVDLRELTLDGLRGRIALVAQDTYLFNDTLRGECPPRPARGDARGDRARAAPGGARRVRRRPAGRACRRASASAACSSPAVSASASPSRAPS